MIKNHKIQEGNHAACSITEVIEDESFAFAPVLTKGFYFWDESESNPCGPFDNLKLAIEARNSHYNNLHKEY